MLPSHLICQTNSAQIKSDFFPCRGGQDSSICETISALFFAKGRSGILLNENAYSNVIHFTIVGKHSTREAFDLPDQLSWV